MGTRGPPRMAGVTNAVMLPVKTSVPPRISPSAESGRMMRKNVFSGLAPRLRDVPTIARILLERHETEWTAWRCEQITSWVAEARAVLKRIRPDGILGLFGVPWRLADHNGAIRKIVGQDYRALSQYVDVFSPMVYHLLTAPQDCTICALALKDVE